MSEIWLNRTHVGDCRSLMRAMISDGVKVQCIVTSPPYWGLRDYQILGQYGQERTWHRHVARMRSVFRLCCELLADDGVLWLNYGDSYGCNKNLIGMPWRIAFALQADGWILRQDIIWSKSNPMPESVRDRCTKAHEYLFLMSKRPRYYWDFDAMQEPANGTTPHDLTGGFASAPGQPPQSGSRAHARRAIPCNKRHAGADKYAGGDEHHRTKGGLVKYATKMRKLAAASSGIKSNDSMDNALSELRETRNRRSVWTITTEPYKDAHFATFPRALIQPAILATSRPGDVVLDPFMGSGTVAEVASIFGRQFIGCELNPDYAAMFKTSRSQQMGIGI